MKDMVDLLNFVSFIPVSSLWIQVRNLIPISTNPKSVGPRKELEKETVPTDFSSEAVPSLIKLLLH